MRLVNNFYDEMTGMENFYRAWQCFRLGKSKKMVVQKFVYNLENNLFKLKDELDNLTYRHGDYEKFLVYDPKQRIIHKAEIRDRLVHTILAKKLEKIYQPRFIPHSFACQNGRGTHRALFALFKMCRRKSSNFTNNFWYLQCDIRKFFDNINHEILLKIICQTVRDQKFIWLLQEVIESFYCEKSNTGLPLGNFTSQWLGNIYLNELDYFIKNELKLKYYARYADDFIILHDSCEYLEVVLNNAKRFLSERLNLIIHPNKIILKKFTAGIDWVGYRILPRSITMKPATARRMFKKLKLRQKLLIANKITPWMYCETVNSYFGQLKHCTNKSLAEKIIYNFL